MLLCLALPVTLRAMSESVKFYAANLATVAAAIGIAIGCLGLGRLATMFARARAEEPLEAVFQLAIGWGVIALFANLVAFAALPQAPFLLAAVALGGAAALLPWGAPQRWRRNLRLLAATILLVMPLLLIAAAIPAVMFDELAEWLPNARFVYESGIIPTALYPNPHSVVPSYPYAGPLVNDLGSWMVGRFVETPSKLLTVILYGLFGVALASVASGGRGRLGIGAVAAGILLAILLNPTFDPRIALTAYMDGPSAVLAALFAFCAWRAAAGLAADDVTARDWARRGGLIALTMVYARETNLVLLGGYAAGFLVIGRDTLRRDRRTAFVSLAWLLAPPLLGFALWRLYMFQADLHSPLGFRPIAEWDWGDPARIIGALLTDRLANHPWLGLGTLGVTIVTAGTAILTWRRVSPNVRRFGALLGCGIAFWLLFLALAYMGVYTAHESGLAASVWRYASELGPSLLLAAVALGGDVLRPFWPRQPGRAATVLAALAMSLAVLGGEALAARHWRIDCQFAEILATRRIAGALAPELKEARDVAVLSSGEADWMAMAVLYHLDISTAHGVAAEAGADLASLAAALLPGSGGLLLDLRPLDRARLATSDEIPPVTLYRRAEGGPVPIRSLALPASNACPR